MIGGGCGVGGVFCGRRFGDRAVGLGVGELLLLRAVPGAEGARVIIVRGECALLNMGGAVRTYETDANRCRRCGACSKLGCPAISGRSPVIDAKKCVGCGMCASVCKCSAIRERA